MTDKITIRNLNPDLYTQARIAAVENQCTVADIVNDALHEWFESVEPDHTPTATGCGQD